MHGNQRSQVSFLCLNVIQQVRSRDTAAPIGAFMWPLHWSMWVGIFVTLHLTALFLTLYEWNSPFGMTPHGRNRLRVFSYSSALNLCYAILFGRTVATKVTKLFSLWLIGTMWGGARKSHCKEEGEGMLYGKVYANGKGKLKEGAREKNDGDG